MSGRVREQPYALAYAPSEGKLEILTAPPDMSLHPVPREVAERVRYLPSGPIADGNLFVNPTIAGFFNKEWTYLVDELKQAEVKLTTWSFFLQGGWIERGSFSC